VIHQHWTNVQDQGTSLAACPVAPTLGDFADVLETLAERYAAVDENARDWVRGSIVAAGSKLRALRFMLRHSPSPHAMRLLDVGSQIGSLPLYASRFGIRTAAVDNAGFAADCASVLRGYGVDYRVSDVGAAPLPFADGSFDFVTYMDVIEHHAYSPKRVLLEARRVLARKGFLIVTTPNHASLYNRLLLLCGQSVHDPFPGFFDRCAGQAVYLGHHREYTRAELRAALQRTGFRVLECTATEEGIGPQLRAMRWEAAHGWLQAIKKYGRFVAAEALGYLGACLPVPLGRVLWSVGQKV
jgi:SAM-dependent methyltransferase